MFDLLSISLSPPLALLSPTSPTSCPAKQQPTMRSSRPFSALLFALGCLLFATAASAQQQPPPPPPPPPGRAELARVASSVAASTASIVPCVWTDFVTTLEKAAITGTWDFHESGGCDAWTSGNLLEAFGGDASALAAAGFSNAASPPRALPLSELEAYRLRVAGVPSGAALALSPTVTAVAVAPRAPGNQGMIVRAFRRFEALGRGDTVAAERSGGGRAFDARVTFVPAPFPQTDPAGNAAAVDINPYPAGKVVLFVAESPEAAARARAASPSVAQRSPLAAGAATPYLDALFRADSSTLTTAQKQEDPALGYWVAEDVVTSWVGPWKPT